MIELDDPARAAGPAPDDAPIPADEGASGLSSFEEGLAAVARGHAILGALRAQRLALAAGLQTPARFRVALLLGEQAHITLTLADLGLSDPARVAELLAGAESGLRLQLAEDIEALRDLVLAPEPAPPAGPA